MYSNVNISDLAKKNYNVSVNEYIVEVARRLKNNGGGCSYDDIILGIERYMSRHDIEKKDKKNLKYFMIKLRELNWAIQAIEGWAELAKENKL